MDTGNSIVASIVEHLPLGSAAEVSAVSEEAELLNPPALAGISRPTADDLDLPRVFFLKKYIKNGQVQNVRKAHFSPEQQTLNLSETDITGSGLTGLHAPQLEDLNLSCCYDITDSGLLELLTNNCDKLKRLDLSGTKITGTGLTGLHAPQLEDLNLKTPST